MKTQSIKKWSPKQKRISYNVFGDSYPVYKNKYLIKKYACNFTISYRASSIDNVTLIANRRI